MEMQEIRKVYKENFEKYYHRIHCVAVSAQEHKKEKDTKKLIRLIKQYRDELTGQINLMEVLDEETPYKIYEEERSRVYATFDSYYLFGVVMGKDDYVFGGDDKGNFRIQDLEAWNNAEKQVADIEKAKAARHTPSRLCR